jgi:hypothetical protein
VHVNLEGVKGILWRPAPATSSSRTSRGGSNADFDFAPSSTHLVIHEQFVRHGEDGALIAGDDFSSTVRFQLTINADGVPTVQRLEQEVKCRVKVETQAQ